MSRKNTRTDVWKHIDMCDGDRTVCWPWKLVPGAVSRAMREGTQSSSSKPRPYFSLAGKKVLATRIVYEDVHGVTLTDDEVIRHTCDNSMCCNPYHMESGTHDENMLDMVERDRHGMPHHVVRAIRRLLAEGRSQQSIADLYGVSRSAIKHIKNGTSNTHAEDYDSGIAGADAD